MFFAFLDSFPDYGYLSLLLLSFVGTILTLLTQSSSAATAITLFMLVEGLDFLPQCPSMILGATIGTNSDRKSCRRLFGM